MKVILLDIGNVIVSVDFGPFCRAVARDGADRGGQLRQRYCQGPLKDRVDRGLVAPGAFLHMLAADPLTVDRPAAFFRTAWQKIFTPVPGSGEAIRQLGATHEIWIMSDTDPLHFAHLLDAYPVMRGHDRYFLSYEHGWLKREAGAFRHLLDRSGGLMPEDFLLIDDRPSNVATCTAAGMQAILFDGWAGVLADPLVSERYSIT